MSAKTSKARIEAYFTALAETGNQTIFAEGPPPSRHAKTSLQCRISSGILRTTAFAFGDGRGGARFGSYGRCLEKRYIGCAAPLRSLRGCSFRLNQSFKLTKATIWGWVLRKTCQFRERMQLAWRTATSG